jgi:signal transduction histidine kinase
MKSIRSKLWFGMMVLVGIIILLLWLFQIIFLEKFYSVLEVNSVIGKAENIVKELEKLNSLEEMNTSAPLNNTLNKLIYEKQLTIQIINESKYVVYQESSGNTMGMGGSMMEPSSQVIQSAFQGNITKQQITHPRFGVQFLYIGLPIPRASGLNGVMLITMPMASVEDTADILKKQLVIITGILLLVSLVLSFRLSKRFADPILKISRQAEAYTVGQLNVRIKDAGKDEIGQLADRMNRMGDVLLQNELLQKEIIANVSHELRTPLALIRGYAETLRDVSGDNPEKRSRQLNIIVEESERLSDIVEDILKLSQLQAGAASLKKEVFSLQDILLKIKDHYQLQEEAHTLQMKGVAELQDGVIGDPMRIEQVLRNLLDNAFRHSKEHEPVEVSAVSVNNHIRVEVIDHGEGIAKEDQEHIFERYYRGKREDGKKSKGTGLGLAIVKSILELHQMPYGVISEQGKGTTFWFELEKANSHTSF